MSYDLAVEGVIERLLTIPSLNKVNNEGKQVGVLKYEPTSVDPPTCWLLFNEYERQQAGQVTVMDYSIVARLALRWQDFEQAEQELIPYINSIPAAIDLDPHLGGRIGSGRAAVLRASGVFISIGGTVYRGLDTIIGVVDKGPFKGGL